MKTIPQIYDTTLRDGAQDPRISFSVYDKLKIAERLDMFGVHFIEGGWPGANEKDSEFFEAAKRIKFKRAQLVAFGMTCAKNIRPEEDQQLAKLLAAETKIITIVGKTSRTQVERTLGISVEENLRIISETCRFLVSNGRKVFFDAEHFFDGCVDDCSYSLACIKAAQSGGASSIILCDTRGGSLPSEIGIAVSAVKERVFVPIGIHAHNDGGLALANSLAAICAGAGQVQGTINGYGERCGNANLCLIIPALKIKMGLNCVSDEDLRGLTGLAMFTAEIANLPLEHNQPYVGCNAFRHKAGLHVNAISKDSESYNHINPELVGNIYSVLVSEHSGKSNIEMKAKEFGISLSPDQVKKVLGQIESSEKRGFQFEGADGSLKLIMLRQQEGYRQPFGNIEWNASSRKAREEKPVDSATIKLVIINTKEEIAYNVADGDGPVNALDNALRKALLPHFPYLGGVKLVDYKVRVLSGEKGTAKAVRILIDFSDKAEQWTTVGCSTDSIEASLQALLDGFEYAILKAH